jgi:hypothetical protein
LASRWSKCTATFVILGAASTKACGLLDRGIRALRAELASRRWRGAQNAAAIHMIPSFDRSRDPQKALPALTSAIKKAEHAKEKPKSEPVYPGLALGAPIGRIGTQE